MLIVFAGPTLATHDISAGITVLPPAAQGDVYRAARSQPWGIGIVDGFFEHVPAVWHKEILWAVSQGIRVFGAASMGALRAAELADFGMVGVGRIFEQYRTGELTADDEVAVAHLSAEHGYRRVSEALVDVRATVEAARAHHVCTAAQADALLAAAKALHYAARTWPAILGAASAAGPLDDFARWLEAGRVDQKRLDALALVDAMLAARHRDERPPITFAFERTDIWERAIPRLREEGDTAARSTRALLDELRLLGDQHLYSCALQGALVRALSTELVEKHGVAFGPESVQRTAIAYRRMHGLHASDAHRAWLDEQELDAAGYARMMRSEAAVRWATAVSEPEIWNNLADQLRAMSCHGRLQRHARAKQQALEREAPDVDALVADDTLWQWYFGERLGRSPPADLAAYAEHLGYASLAAMRVAVAIERWFSARSPR